MLTVSQYLWEAFKAISTAEGWPTDRGLVAPLIIKLARTQHPALGAKADLEMFGGLPCYSSQIFLQTDDSVPVDKIQYWKDNTWNEIDFVHAV